MKKRSFVLAVVFALTLVLTGCSADRGSNTMEPSRNVGSDSGVYETNDGNDAFEGGGAGGTNDRDNDGQPDGGAGGTNDQVNDGQPVGGADSDDRSGVGQAVDDIGRDAGDMARGIGDAARDAGDAIGDAVDDIDRDMR